MKRLFLLAFFLIIVLEFSGQIIPVRRFTTNEGLPSNSVRHVMKDSHGFIWIGTDGGACRYDGKEFAYYNMLDGLPGNRVWSIAEDSSGVLWFGCYNAGIAKFDGKKFTAYTVADGLVDDYVREIGYSASLDAILVATSNGFSIFKDGKFRNYNQETPGVGMHMLTTGFLEKEGRIYVFNFGSRNYVIDPKYGFGIQPMEEERIDKFPSTSSIHVLSDGTWAQGYDRQGLMLYKKDTTLWYKEAGQVFGVAEGLDGDLWVSGWDAGLSTGSGLFHIENGSLVPYNHLIGSKSIRGWKLFYDRSNRFLWYCTLDEGLYVIQPSFFTYYQKDYFDLENITIKDLLWDTRDNLWLALDTMVVCKRGDEVKFYPKHEFIDARIQRERKEFDFLYPCMNDPGGNFEKAEQMLHDGLISYNPYEEISGNVVEILPAGSMYEPDAYRATKAYIFSRGYREHLSKDFLSIGQMEMDSKGKIFISTSLGLYSYDKTADRIAFEKAAVREAFAFDEADTLVYGDYWSMDLSQLVYNGRGWEHAGSFDFEHDEGARNVVRVVPHNNETWIASMTVGLVLLSDGLHKAFTKSYPEMDKYITDIAIGPDGAIYAGGSSGCIYVIRKHGRDYDLERTINPPDVSYGNSVMWLSFDGQGKLYVGMNQGLNIISAEDLEGDESPSRKFFGVEEGYSSSLASNPALGPEGDIWVGTEGGLLKINTDLINHYTLTNTLPLLSEVKVYDTHKNKDTTYSWDIHSNKKVTLKKLSHSQNQLTINFRYLDYFERDRIMYEFTLDNGNRIWQEKGLGTRILYPALEPGNYKFSISAHHIITGQDFGPESIFFTIKKPWWRLLGVNLSFLILVIFLAWAIAHWRIRTVRRQELEKREVARQITQLEVTALQAQINPHFIFNSITGIQNFILKKDDKTALKYLGDLSYVLRQTLEKSFQQLITLEDEIAYLNRYLQLEQMRYKDLITADILIDPSLDLKSVRVPPMILQPLVENAIRHGLLPKMKPGTVRISIKPAATGSIMLTVEDDGVGRKRASEITRLKALKQRSFGLEITRRRLEALEKSMGKGSFTLNIEDLEDVLGNPAGTRVTILLPKL